MKIPLRPPTSPLQDAILKQLQSKMQTKEMLGEALNRPAFSLTRALKSLVAQGKVKQEVLNREMYYCLPTQAKGQGS